ncbi:cell wall / vacuolar inhibitor of fructosidase 1-like [Senna tora]|uniref:Cell wall / vacuolar inhibitor of fructosidase 1-like n=1 Tax=Senna tora TaxID=362788 RepID=A0A834X3P8_9FABA|nr:cell wall / vacuolar inhibitor of fructosidase 1-like [Senna tora]
MTGLALIMVNAIKATAQQAQTKIQQELKGHGSQKKALNSCAERYRAVVEGDVPEAIEALQKGDPKFAEQGANDAALEATSSLIKQTSDQNLEEALAFCAESYIPLVKYTLPQAADAISQARFGFATYCISDALKEITNCDKKFSASASPQDQSLLGDRNGILQKLLGVAAAILKLLIKG